MRIKVVVVQLILILLATGCIKGTVFVRHPVEGQLVTDNTIAFEAMKNDKNCTYTGPFSAIVNRGTPNETDITNTFTRPANSNVWTATPYSLPLGEHTLSVEGRFQNGACKGGYTAGETVHFTMGGNPSLCQTFLGWVDHPEASMVLPFNNVPFTAREFAFGFLGENGTISGSSPSDQIGFAFFMSWESQSHGFPVSVSEAIAGRYFVLQYELPDVACTQQMQISVSPEVQFPTGHLILPRPGAAAITIETFSFVDPTLDLRSINPEAAWNRVQGAHTILSTAGNSQVWSRWSTDQNTGANVVAKFPLSLNVQVNPGHSNKLFIVVSIAIQAGGEGTGATLTTSDDATQDFLKGAIVRDRAQGERRGPAYTFLPSP